MRNICSHFAICQVNIKQVWPPRIHKHWHLVLTENLEKQIFLAGPNYFIENTSILTQSARLKENVCMKQRYLKEVWQVLWHLWWPVLVSQSYYNTLSSLQNSSFFTSNFPSKYSGLNCNLKWCSRKQANATLWSHSYYNRANITLTS